ncbi:MAG: preprotein translocase subunit SecE [Chloroflexi bacterium]|nr:preprotein translocase subunit SecE [Chloroflexota bacterium]MCH8225188.1 preprotein translocase subunit SecE [Chloroflexota bacterium]MCI0846174.1 preprotein translocase subunit SecE [Chloroflexota bacterium]
MARASTRSTRSISPGAAGRISPVTFLQETASELRKSVWPSREETARLTMVVIVLSVVASFFLGGLDRIFSETFSRVIF